MWFFKLFSDLFSAIQSTVSYTMMFVPIALIAITTALLINYCPAKWLAVTLSTLFGCFLMVPVTVAFGKFVDLKVANAQKNHETQETVVTQNMIIEGLQNEIRNLENTMFNVQGFEKILELGLLETNLTQPTVTRERFDEKYSDGYGGFFKSGEYYEYLEVTMHDIIVKFGVDLKSIKLTNSAQDINTIIISGVNAKFLGTTKHDTHWEIQEIRKVSTDADNNPVKTEIMDAKEYQKKIIDYLQKSQKTYQQRLNQGLETEFMNDSVEKFAENFIRLILVPLGKNIVFSNKTSENSLSLLEYLKQEKELKVNELKIEKKKELPIKATPDVT